MIDARFVSLFLLILVALPITTINQKVDARMEETIDTNNGLKFSMEAPEDWNSGKISTTILSLDWNLNGLFATNFANKFFGAGQEAISFFVVVNAPTLANPAMPFIEKLGLISLALSQFVTLNSESDLYLSDGSPAHLYSMSMSQDQLRRLNIPSEKAIDAVLITTQIQGKTYLVAYSTEAGRITEYQPLFEKMLDSVNLGGVTFT
jgi:hypothetical protein